MEEQFRDLGLAELVDELLVRNPPRSAQPPTRSPALTCSAKISSIDAPSSWRAICRSAAFRSGIASQ